MAEKYCEGLDCMICDEKEPCIYKIANKLVENLEAKEQECKEINLANERLVAEKYALNEEILKYKQAVNEIEELAKHNNLLVRDPFCGPGYRDLSGQILTIVKKAKGS